jgi:hypothetical protein
VAPEGMVGSPAPYALLEGEAIWKSNPVAIALPNAAQLDVFVSVGPGHVSVGAFTRPGSVKWYVFSASAAFVTVA